jgi:serine phosphatase RsbU (regulator of sigma subunit)/ketosteroid isomerase-like protein
VNKLPVNAPGPAGWHHAWCRPGRETKVGKEEEEEALVSEVEEKNMALARRFLEALVKGDLDAVDEMLAPDFVNHSELLSVQAPDREGVKWAIAQYTAAFSNASIHFEDQVAAGDKVVSRCFVRATHDRGELMGLAPTGREMAFMPVFIHRIVEGKIAEQWSIGTIGSKLREQLLEQERIERERIEQELRVARRIQQASLPDEVPTLEGWQVSPYYQPAREVGGDFYDFFDLEEGRVGVVVGDATGKGMPAALVAEATSNMLRAVAQALGSSSPGKVLAQVNETLVARIPPNMFVTCFYGVLDPKSGSLRYANAGHDLPHVRHGDGDAEELRARGMPLGLMPSMSYEEKEIVLRAGEAALFYSDGLVEAHDPKGEMFGFPRLRALVAEHDDERSLVDSLLEELYSFTGEGWEQEDDITLLTLRRSASLG